MTAVASQPTTRIHVGSVSRPIARGLVATSMMTAVASTPLTTAALLSALIGSSDGKFSATPPSVAVAIVS